MVLYQSQFDNLIIEREWYMPEGINLITARYGMSEPLAVWESSGNDQIDTRIARQWIIDNRWNGNI